MESTIRDDYKDYYMYLEQLRQSGIVNMFGARPYLQEEFCISEDEASDILKNWMHNYS